MSWSLGEIGALATKAARGSGMDWGLADEAGYAVKWLQRRQLPGVAALCRYLSWRQVGEITIGPMIQRVMVIIVQLPLALPMGMVCLGMMCNLPASEHRYC